MHYKWRRSKKSKNHRILFSALFALLLLIIFSAAGSAQTMMGDVNGDGKINVHDVVLVQKQVLQKITLTEQQRAVADVNGDGDIDVRDVTLIMQRAVGNISSFPLQVTKVDEITKTVSFGTLQANIGLPPTVDATISDGVKRDISVDWETTSTPAYNPNVPGNYVFMGNLVNMPIGITNPNAHKAKATITVTMMVWPTPPPYSFYTLTVIANPPQGGIVTGSGSYLAGPAPVSATANSGYTFVNWTRGIGGPVENGNSDFTFIMPAANTTLVANFSSVTEQFTVTYSANSATGGNAPIDSNNYLPGDTVTVLGNTGSLVKTGYAFAGWNTQADGSGTTYQAGDTFVMGSANVTLYAKWTANSYTVSFDAQGGTLPQPADKQVTFGQPYGALATTTLTGQTFAGWFTAAPPGGTQISAATAVTTEADHTLYARWTESATYAVTYNANGATGGSVPVDGNIYLQGDTVTVLGNTGSLVKTGHTFAGWNTAANGLGTNYQAGGTFVMGSANMTLYAKWTDNSWPEEMEGSPIIVSTIFGFEVTVTIKDQYKEQVCAVTVLGVSATKLPDNKRWMVYLPSPITIGDLVDNIDIDQCFTITAIAPIQGEPGVGNTLSAGALTPAVATATYQWTIADNAGGPYSNIADATSSSYTPVAANEGKFLKVVATGTGDDTGNVTSVAAGPVLASGFVSVVDMAQTRALQFFVGETVVQVFLKPGETALSVVADGNNLTYNGTYWQSEALLGYTVGDSITVTVTTAGVTQVVVVTVEAAE